MALLFVLKMVLLRYFFYGEIAWGRVTADAASVLVLLSLVELLSPMKAKNAVYWALNAVYSLALFASTLYFSHFGSVPTYTALTELHQVGEIGSSVQATIRLSNYLYFADLIAGAVIGIVRKAAGGRRLTSARPVWKTGAALTLVLCATVCARFIQLGLPIDNELVESENVGFLGYQVASAIKSAEDNSVEAEGSLSDIVKEYDAFEAANPFSPPGLKTPVYFGSMKGKNVILVQMEAFQNFALHLKLGGKELTPVLNKLADESFYFPHIFQQIGQGNTSDAEFMSNTSIYPTGKIAMSTGYGDRKLPSMPRLLQERGYEADTFHVNNVVFWDRIKLYPALNFNHYYDKPFYHNDHFNSFGASDEELYRVGVDKLSALQQQHKPFYAQFITVSSHFPFDVPDDRKKIDVPASMEGSQLGKYLTALNYTDYAIGTLIDRLKANGMWDNTVLVLYGDHFGLQPQDNDPGEVTKQLGIPYDPRITRFNIPLIIHMPGETAGKVIDQVGGQLDIMPTVANLLGISLKDEKFVAFGHDLLNIDRNVFGMRYYLPTGSFFNDDILFVPGKGFDDGTAVSIRTLKPVKDFSKYRKDYDYVLKLMDISDRYVRALPKRK
nr:LTA synthase family protein [Paenibacillus humicola]